MYEFTDKICLITGGANGIGLAYTKELINSGVKVVIIVDKNYENGTNAVNELGDSVIFIHADVTDEMKFENAFLKAISQFGKLDIVINNAGIMNDLLWKRQINVNIDAVTFGVLLGFKYMGKDKGGFGGIIVNTSSLLGIQHLASLPMYSATKSYIITLGRCFGTLFFYNLTGVKLLTVCPGMTLSALFKNARMSDQFIGLVKYSHKIAIQYRHQKPNALGKGLITILNEGINGGVWIVENNNPPRLLEPQLPIVSDINAKL